MEQIFLGDVIKRRRLELNLTQEQLCQGICEPITVSRLENGKHTPSYHRINALLERLDLPADRYYALLNKNESDIEALRKRIVACNLRFEHSLGDEKVQARTEALQVHKELEAIIDKDDMANRQLILRSRVIIGKEDGPYSLEEQNALLLEAIHLTCPSFDLNDISRGLYTTDEIKIISHLASVNYYAENYLAAVDIWGQLYKYIHKHFQCMPPTRSHLNMILFNYATALYKISQYQKALEIAEEGRRVCLDYGHYECLPGMLEVMADCHRCLGDSEKSKKFYYQTYYLCQAVGATYEAEITRRELKEYFGLEPDF